MAPEQWRAGKQDLRTDIYAFGIVVYEMCYGRLPFPGPTLERFAEQHLRVEPQTPPGVFAEIIARCLSKEPDARYASSAELLDELSRACKANRIPLPPKPKVVGDKSRELFALAQALGGLGKHQEAIAACRELVEHDPDASGNWLELGRNLLQSGDYAGARQALERSLSLDATRSPAWNNLGVSLNRLEKWQNAIFAFDRALDCDPFNTGAMLNCTAPLRSLGRGMEAIIRLKRAVELAPDDYVIWNNLGLVHIDLGDKANALDCLQRARALSPDHQRSLIDGNIRLAQKLPDEATGAALMAINPALARQRLQEEVNRDPRDKKAWHNLGLLHINARKYADARECFVRVRELDASNSFAICRVIELSASLKDITSVGRVTRRDFTSACSQNRA